MPIVPIPSEGANSSWVLPCKKIQPRGRGRGRRGTGVGRIEHALYYYNYFICQLQMNPPKNSLDMTMLLYIQHTSYTLRRLLDASSPPKENTYQANVLSDAIKYFDQCMFSDAILPAKIQNSTKILVHSTVLFLFLDNTHNTYFYLPVRHINVFSCRWLSPTSGTLVLASVENAATVTRPTNAAATPNAVSKPAVSCAPCPYLAIPCLNTPVCNTI